MYDEGLRALGWLNVFLVVLFFYKFEDTKPIRSVFRTKVS